MVVEAGKDTGSEKPDARVGSFHQKYFFQLRVSSLELPNELP